MFWTKTVKSGKIIRLGADMMYIARYSISALDEMKKIEGR